MYAVFLDPFQAFDWVLQLTKGKLKSLKVFEDLIKILKYIYTHR